MERIDILAEHKKEQIGASFDTDYRVIERCIPDCPACAQRRLVEWLDSKMGHTTTSLKPLKHERWISGEDWRDLCRGVLGG